MKAYIPLLFGLLLFAPSSGVRAEGNCPPGEYPIGAPPGQNGPQACAPIPGNEGARRPRGPRVVEMWGAIAVDKDSGIWGANNVSASKRKAKKAAQLACRQNGGEKCAVKVTFQNGCGALVVGNGFQKAVRSFVINAATWRAEEACKKSGDSSCHMVYAQCTPIFEI